jgi:hypothetical protein
MEDLIWLSGGALFGIGIFAVAFWDGLSRWIRSRSRNGDADKGPPEGDLSS